MADTVSSVVGIDISKKVLDVCLLPQNFTKQFANDKIGLKAFVKWAKYHQPERLVCEATGVYSRALEKACAAVDLPLAKINPCRARRFAEATGRLAKTDKIDAAILAKFGAVLAPEIQKPKSETLDILEEYLTARQGLVKDRTALKNRQKNLTDKMLIRMNEQQLAMVEKQISKIDEKCAELLSRDADLAARQEILTSIPGIGLTTAMSMLILMPELGTMNARQTASLAGVAPVTRESGNWKGKSFIQGGRKILRKTLYMPALVASRFNADLKRKYDEMIKKGKPKKVAITAIMRKLIIAANALLRDNRKWVEISV